MSLIQDALKRQLEESEGNRVPLKSVVSPSVPDTMPVPPHPEPAHQPLPANQPLPQTAPANPTTPAQSGKSWKQIAGIIIFCILIAWSCGLLVIVVLKQSPERALLGKFMPDLANTRVTLDKPTIKASPPPAHQPAEAMPKPVVTPAPTIIPWISPAAANAPALGDEQENGEDVDLPSVNKQELSVTVPSPIPVAVPRPVVPVVWPRLKLSAIFSDVGSGQAGARLNNRLILLGDQIEGVTLVGIRQDSVVLKCGTEIRFLKMGMTLN